MPSPPRTAHQLDDHGAQCVAKALATVHPRDRLDVLAAILRHTGDALAVIHGPMTASEEVYMVADSLAVRRISA